MQRSIVGKFNQAEFNPAQLSGVFAVPRKPNMASTASPLTAENLAKRDGSGYKPGQIILLDIPAPANIIACLPDPTNPNRRESAVIRFSTVSCRPREFVSKGHALRPSLFARPRRIRLLVTVLISSDDSETDVRNTLHAILSSVEAIDAACDLGEPVSWKQIVVLLIGCTKSDGMLAESENLLRRLGLFTPPEPAPREMGWGGQVYEVRLHSSKLLIPLSVPGLTGVPLRTVHAAFGAKRG